ncbi:MAG TPA: PP2C family protein-serine/threonine phosphatase [Bacteroidota bacterium]
MPSEEQAVRASRRSLLTIGTALLVIVVAGIVLWRLFIPVDPYSSVTLPLSRDQILDTAMRTAGQLGAGQPLVDGSAELNRSVRLSRAIIKRDGQAPGTLRLRESGAGVFWQIRWRPGESGKAARLAERRGPIESDLPADRRVGDFWMRLTPRGELISYENILNDSARLVLLPEGVARAMADSAVQAQFRRFVLTGSAAMHLIDRPARQDYRFTYSARDSALGLPVQIEAEVAGNSLASLSAEHDLAALPAADEKGSIVRGIGVAVLLLLVGIAVIVIGIRRVRALEISFRLALWLGALVGIGTVITSIPHLLAQGMWELVLAVVLSVGFIGGAFALLWAVGESVAREVWQEKFASLDLLTRGYVLHSRVGRSLLSGLAAGAAASALWLVGAWGVESLFPFAALSPDADTFAMFSFGSPALLLVFHDLATGLFLATLLGVFLLSLLRTRIASPWILAVVAALATGFFDKTDVSPFYVGVVVAALPYLVLAWLFLTGDVLALITGTWAFAIVGVLPVLFAAQSATLAGSGVAILVLMLLLAAWAIAGMLTRDPTVDIEAISPAFVQHISERQRLQRELEIAREVQQSFLPKSEPEMPTLDIASRCLPAQEVGGDYYDFLRLDGGRLGVVVGDVSGKGTQAAFFMTLTKGFLRAVTRTQRSPAEVLDELNELFYENVERGTFISMLYAVLDTAAGTMTIARAGHNPALLKEGSTGTTRFLLSPGLALGLAPGEQFTSAIEEETLPFCPGDVLVLYTDGFTEAMNSKHEEFGEERLKEALLKANAGRARELLDELYRAAKHFAGHHPQHDDMTMVVVRHRGSGGIQA